ncbi:MAG: MarR family transcriptional regulator [Eubacterium sp.]|nr:MarR family transcriptional regulator [Eubacterium sp.]
MDYTELSEEICQVHIRYAGIMNRMQSLLLSKGEDSLLIWLDTREDKVTSRDIADHFQLTTGRVANILKSAENKGYILRTQNTEDLRRVYVELTSEGRDRARKIYRQMVKEHSALLELLGEQRALGMIETMEDVFRLVTESEIYAGV